MRRIGRKGEKIGDKKTLYLHHLWNDLLKELSKKSGQSQSVIVEWCLSASLEEFKEKFGLNREEAKSEKEKEKILDVEEAFKLGKKELVAYAQRTSEKRIMQDIIFEKHESGIDNFMNDEPQNIWERITSRKNKRSDGWENEGWREIQ